MVTAGIVPLVVREVVHFCNWLCADLACITCVFAVSDDTEVTPLQHLMLMFYDRYFMAMKPL